MKANRKKLMLAMARACMDTEDLQKAAEMPRPTLNNAICGGICWDACRQAARTRAIQRPYACYADAFGRPGGMEEDLYNG